LRASFRLCKRVIERLVSPPHPMPYGHSKISDFREAGYRKALNLLCRRNGGRPAVIHFLPAGRFRGFFLLPDGPHPLFPFQKFDDFPEDRPVVGFEIIAEGIVPFQPV